MGDESREVSLRLLLKFCLEQEAQERMESYLSPQELKELYPDMTALDHKVSKGIHAIQKDEKRRLRRPLRVLKRALLVAAVLISMFTCTLLTSASVRNAVVNTIIDWTGRDVGFQFIIEGEPLSALPDGYGPHYIPDGFIFEDNNAIIEPDFIDLHYISEDKDRILSVGVSVLQNSSQTRMDNEHTEYEMITFQGTEAYVGHWISVDGIEGYFMIWAKDGIENQIYGTVSFSELIKIAENIY